jgi:hypothetical protein
MWQRVDERTAICLDLMLICKRTRPVGYRQRALVRKKAEIGVGRALGDPFS